MVVSVITARACRPLALVAAALTGAALLAGCTAGSRPAPRATVTHTATVTAAPSVSSPVAPSTSPSQPAPTTTAPRRGHGTPVHVSLYEGDGDTYGVAMPIIAYFSVAPTDATVFDQVVTVKVNGTVVHGAWYFEHSSRSDQAMEAHYRLPHYWPAHSTVTVDLPLQGLWAGTGLVFSDSLTLRMQTGARHIVKVNGRTEKMAVYRDGTRIRVFKISLGTAQTPTYLGTAVVMGKSNPQLMTSAPGEPYYRIEVPWSVRVTYDGEFLHDAYWNGQLGQANLSHGCTNMAPADAKWYYTWSLIGDPVTWTHTGTSKVVPVDDGWGDWNLPFAQYARGGLLASAT